MSSELSPLARMVLLALEREPGASAETLALATKLPAGVVDSVLAELHNGGRVEEVAPRRFRALARPGRR